VVVHQQCLTGRQESLGGLASASDGSFDPTLAFTTVHHNNSDDNGDDDADSSQAVATEEVGGDGYSTSSSLDDEEMYCGSQASGAQTPVQHISSPIFHQSSIGASRLPQDRPPILETIIPTTDADADEDDTATERMIDETTTVASFSSSMTPPTPRLSSTREVAERKVMLELVFGPEHPVVMTTARNIPRVLQGTASPGIVGGTSLSFPAHTPMLMHTGEESKLPSEILRPADIVDIKIQQMIRETLRDTNRHATENTN
jgi:hypothetical protein